MLTGLLKKHPFDFYPRSICFAAAADTGGGGGGGGAGGQATGSTGGEGNGQGAEGSSGGGVDAAALARQNAELRTQIEGLTQRTKELTEESIGRKKSLQQLRGVLGDLSPDELQANLERLRELEQAENVRRGEYDKEREAWGKEREKLKGEKLSAEKREAQRMKESAILAGAAANSPLPQALAIAPGTARPAIVLITDDAFEYDKDTGETLHRTERDPETNKRLTPAQFFAKERKGTLAYLFASTVLPGGSATARDAEGGAGDVVEIAHDDPDKVAKVEAAEKAGKKSRIVRRAIV